MTDTPTTDEVRDLFIYGAWEKARNGCDDDLNADEFDRWLAADRKAQRAEALREAVMDMRKVWPGHWNLPDPRDPTISYSVDRWLEVRAERIEASDVE
jgi:hypothetical protein